MLSELTMELEIEDKAKCGEIGYFQSSNFQGILMENIDNAYAERLHGQGWNPYSQHIENKDKLVWKICTLNKEAYENIVLPLMDAGFDGFEIKKKDIAVKIVNKSLKTKSKYKLMENFYSDKTERNLMLEFITPTSFKSNGRYVIIPELRYIYQSLMNKYSAASDGMDMCDEDTLAQMVTNSFISQYKLRSTTFPMEGVKIPSFMGELGIRINGTDTMARYIRLLTEFGEYSGAGIKTGMGMGAVRIKERCVKNDR